MPLFDLLLLSVMLISGFLGPLILRRFGPEQRLYGILVVADLGLALVSYVARFRERATQLTDTLGAIAIGGALGLILVPPLLRNAGRWAMARGRLRTALALAELRDILQPGMGARPEKALLHTILTIREGREDEIVAALSAQRQKATATAVRDGLDEQIAMTYLYARRWTDAISLYETQVRRLGVAPSLQLSAEMIRAYCETGDLESARAVMEEVEASPLARQPALAALVDRARLTFLAFAGEVAAVRAAVGKGGPLATLPAAARALYCGVAELAAGDAEAARVSLERAVRCASDPRFKERARAYLARVAEPSGAPPSPEVRELAARIAGELSARPSAGGGAEPGVLRLSGVSWRSVPTTTALVAVNVAAALVIVAVFGSSEDVGALVLAGANVKAATLAGDWWRLVSSMFLHVGAVHLGLNMVGLWVLGRLVEQLYGPVRMFGLYMLSGIVGSAASVFFGGGATSAGASGAVLGLLGATVVELARHRRRHRQRGLDTLLANLLFLTVANVAIGFLYPVIDQAVHVAGLLAGAALGLLLSRQVPPAAQAPLTHLARALALFGVAALGYALLGVANDPIGETMRRMPVRTLAVPGFEVSAPQSFESDGKVLFDAGLSLQLQFWRIPDAGAGVGAEDLLREHLRAELGGGAVKAGFDGAALAESPRVLLPAPWRSAELKATAEGAGAAETYRILVAARAAEGELWLAVVYYPEILGGELEPLLVKLLGSLRPL